MGLTGEHERAEWWRQRVVKLTREALATALGYTNADTIWYVERGKIKRPATMARYKTACERVHREKFPRDYSVFDWRWPIED